jgi:hypothetical protein
LLPPSCCEPHNRPLERSALAARHLPAAGDHLGTWRAARAEADGITEADAREALLQLDPLWDELFPAEQARIPQLLVERVDVLTDGVDIQLTKLTWHKVRKDGGSDGAAAASTIAMSPRTSCSACAGRMPGRSLLGGGRRT